MMEYDGYHRTMKVKASCITDKQVTSIQKTSIYIYKEILRPKMTNVKILYF